MYTGYYYGFDYTYLLLVVPALILSLIAQVRVKSVFAKYKGVRNSRGLTGAAAAREILDANGLFNVGVEQVAGQLTDHYDPQSNVIRLSQDVYSGDSVASVGVAAHEAGHAVQYGENYAPIKLRSALIPITNFGATLSWPLIIAGLLLSFSILAYIGIALFSLSVLFQLVTLPVEVNASNRAIKVIDERGLLADDELTGAKKVLRAAAMTYLAALAVSIANLLRLLVLVGRRRE